jgi:hypothetical protein
LISLMGKEAGRHHAGIFSKEGKKPGGLKDEEE